MQNLRSLLETSPIIAAARGGEQVSRALASPVKVVFVLGGDLFSLPEQVEQVQSAGKLAFVHLDLVEGISRDAAGVRWASRTLRPAGVLSTRPPLLRHAAEEGMLTVLRMFMVDSSSVETGVRMVKGCAPDLVEVMPGLVTRAIHWLGEHITQPVIAGGMLEKARDVEAALEAGALAASTSSEALWKRERW